MKRLFVPYKAAIRFAGLLTFFIFSFTSCKKNEQRQSLSDTTVQKVNEWMEKQKTGRSEAGMAKIEAVVNSMQLPALRKENLTEIETMYIIPLDDSYIPKFNDDKPSLNVLLLIEDWEGKIRKGNIVQFTPPPGNNLMTEIPENTFHDFYRGMTPVLGKFTFLNLTGNFQYEIENREGDVKVYKVNSKKNNAANTTTTEGCTEWYWVTTTTYPDGRTEEDWEYMYTTCDNCEPWEDCSENGGGGGGGSGGGEQQSATPVADQRDWQVAKPTSGFWTVWSTEGFTGLKTNTDGQYGGHFTGASHLGDLIVNHTPIIHTWQKIGATVSHTTYHVTAAVSGKVTDPADYEVFIPTKYKGWAFYEVF